MSYNWSRIKSRQSAAGPSSRVPAFQPPSFYAAAAGLSYPEPPQQNQRGNVDSTYSDPAHGAQIMYPTAEEDPGDEVGESRRKRASSLSRPFSRAPPKTPREEKGKAHERKKSQMVEIPFLETQLLPSLKDTIEKMTHQPRQARQEDASRSHENDGSSNYTEGRTSEPLLATNNSRNGRSPVVSSGYTPVSSLKPPSSRPIFANPEEGSTSATRFTSSSHAARPAGQSSRFTKNFVSSPEPSSSRLSPATPSASKLKSPGVQSPLASSKLPTSATPASSPRPRSNSATPRAKQVPQALQPGSSIPRSNMPKRNYATDSGSELEREYGKRLISGKLVVANAEIAPSSSESEHEKQRKWDRSHALSSVDKRKSVYAAGSSRNASPRLASTTSPRPSDAPGSRWRTQSGQNKDASKIGLGFDVYQNKYPAQERRRNRDEVLHEQDDNFRYGAPFEEASRQPLRESLQRPTGEISTMGHSDNDHDHYGRPFDDERLDVHNLVSSSARKRREALVGLVNGLQFDDHPSQPDMKDQRAREDYGPSAYDEDHPRMNSRYEDEQPSQQDHYTAEPTRKSRTKNRRRSNTHHIPNTHSPETPEDEQLASNRDHRRSISVPSRSRPPSRNMDPGLSTSRANSPHEDHRDGPIQERSLSRNFGRRSVSQSNDRRRSVVEEAPEPPQTTKRPSTSRRHSQHQRESALGVPLERRQDTTVRERNAFGIPESLSYAGHDAPAGHENLAPESAGPSGSDYDHQDHEHRIPGSTRSSPDVDRWAEQTDAGGFSSAAQTLLRQLSGSKHDAGHGQSSRPSASRRSSTGTTKSRPSSAHSRSQSTYQVPQQPARSSMVNSVSASSSMPSMYEPEADVEPHAPQRPPDTAPPWRSIINPGAYSALRSRYGEVEMQRQDVIYRFREAQQELVEQLDTIVRVFILPLRRRHSKAWLPGVPKEVSRLFDWLEDILHLHTTLAEVLDAVTGPWSAGEIVVHFAPAIRSFVPRLEIYQPYLVRVDAVRRRLSESTAAQGDEFGEFVRLRETHEECGGWSLSDLLLRPIDHLATCVDTFKSLSYLTPGDHADYLPSLSLYHAARTIVYVLREVKAREEEYEFVKELSTRIEGLLPSVQLARRERRLLWHGDLLWLPTNLAETNGQLKSTMPSINGRLTSSAMPTIVLSPCSDSPTSSKTARDRSSHTRDAPGVVHVLAFTDAILFTQSTSENGLWQLLPEVGISKILNWSSEKGPGPPSRIQLSLLPLSQDDLQNGVIPDNNPITNVCLDLSSRPGQPLSDDERTSACAAFQQCHAYTLRSLSFPSHSGQYLPHGPHLDLELDTQKSVMTILNTGLPLPKSPSVQLTDTKLVGTREITTEMDREREERGWWTLRFQQVLREMQRQDPLLAIQALDEYHTS